MAHADSPMISFVDALWPVRGASRVLRAAVLALLGSALLTLSAEVQVPFYPVPMTMQTLVALLIGMAFGARLGVVTVALYLAEGAVGLPVFAGTPEKGSGSPTWWGRPAATCSASSSPRRSPAGWSSAGAMPQGLPWP